MYTGLVNVLGALCSGCSVHLFYVTGHSFYYVFFNNLSNIGSIWLFPMLVILPLAAIVSRIIYKETNNPYLGGLIMVLIVTIMSCNTLTQL